MVQYARERFDDLRGLCRGVLYGALHKIGDNPRHFLECQRRYAVQGLADFQNVVQDCLDIALKVKHLNPLRSDVCRKGP